MAENLERTQGIVSLILNEFSFPNSKYNNLNLESVDNI